MIFTYDLISGTSPIPTIESISLSKLFGHCIAQYVNILYIYIHVHIVYLYLYIIILNCIYNWLCMMYIYIYMHIYIYICIYIHVCKSIYIYIQFFPSKHCALGYRISELSPGNDDYWFMVDFMVNFDFFAWYNGPIYEVFFVHQKGDDRMIINCETYEHILKHEVMDQYSNIPNTKYIYIYTITIISSIFRKAGACFIRWIWKKGDR